jgi:molybdopterin-binding protein
VTSTADGATVIGEGKVVTSMIANDAVTFDKFQDSASAGLSVIGRGTNSTGAFAEIAAGTNGHVLRLDGTTLGFGTIVSAGIADDAVTNDKLANNAVETANIKDAEVTFAKFENLSALSVIGRSANTSGVSANIAAGTNGHILRRSGNVLEFGQVETAGITNFAVTTDKINSEAVSNIKLAFMTQYKIKGNNTNSSTNPKDLTTQELRTMSNLAPILFGATLLDGITPLNTPVPKSNGMADGTDIPTGTIWYDTTTS